MYRVPRQRVPEQLAAAAGPERWACYAVEDAAGDFAGLTGIVANSAVPERPQAGQTGVEPAHHTGRETAAPLLQPGARRRMLW